MPQISKRHMNPKIEARMFDVFFKSLTDLGKREDVEAYLYDLLSPVERTMLAKRLAIAVLLTKDFSYVAIADVLKVSFPTISSISIWMKHSGKGFEKVIKKILREEEVQKTLKDIERSLAKFLAAHPATKRRIEAAYNREKHERESVI